MENISSKLIKNGITALAEDEDVYFKKNILQSLSIKINNAINEVLFETRKNLFHQQQSIKPSPELETFLSLVESPAKIQLKDDNIINITETEIKALKGLFENLSTENKEKMINSVFNDYPSFKQHIEFYQKSKGLFR